MPRQPPQFRMIFPPDYRPGLAKNLLPFGEEAPKEAVRFPPFLLAEALKAGKFPRLRAGHQTTPRLAARAARRALRREPLRRRGLATATTFTARRAGVKTSGSGQSNVLRPPYAELPQYLDAFVRVIQDRPTQLNVGKAPLVQPVGADRGEGDAQDAGEFHVPNKFAGHIALLLGIDVANVPLLLAPHYSGNFDFSISWRSFAKRIR